MKYVALLRGVNVGKSVKVPMKLLKIQLENIGLKNVITYLNSGNVIFDAEIENTILVEVITNMLEQEYGQRISVLIKTSEEIIKIRESIPNDWKNDETQQTYVAYLFKDVADKKLIDELPIKKQYIEIIYAYEAIIWNIKRENYNKSQITKISSHKSYERMTTRNVNTARRLAEICKDNLI